MGAGNVQIGGGGGGGGLVMYRLGGGGGDGASNVQIGGGGMGAGSVQIGLTHCILSCPHYTGCPVPLVYSTGYCNANE